MVDFVTFFAQFAHQRQWKVLIEEDFHPPFPRLAVDVPRTAEP
jgi:hypothetical protein